MRKRFNKSIITEKDIVFDVVYVRTQGYDNPGGNHTRAGIKRLMRDNLTDMKYIKGLSPKFTEFCPITECTDLGAATAKCVFSCGVSSIKTFMENASLSFDAETMGILGEDGKLVEAYSFTNEFDRGYQSSFDKSYFKWAGSRAQAIYDFQNTHQDSAYIGVKIPESRLQEAIESAYKRKLEEINSKSELKNLEINLGKLTQAYTLVLEWLKDMSEEYNYSSPIPSFSIDFREQDLFANYESKTV